MTILVTNYLNTLPATWLMTAGSSPTPASEHSVPLILVRFSSVGRAPTSATELSVQCSWTSSLEQSADGPQTD